MKKVIKKYDVVILTHAPHVDVLYSISMLLKQKIKPSTIVIYNTDKDIFYQNIKDKDKLNNILKDKKILIKHIKEKDFDHGKARNDAVKYCKSNYVLFMTDDAVPCDDKLASNLLDAFKLDKVAVAYARQVAKKSAKEKERLVREFNYPKYDIVKDKSTEKKYGIKNCFCSNTCAMYDKSIFIKMGKFDTNLPQNEDMLYAHRVIEKGYKVYYKAKALVNHSHDLSYIDQLKRNYDIGKFQKKYKDIYDKYTSEGEGIKLVKKVNESLLKEKKFIDAIDFNLECGFRYIGFLLGKKGL